jgi:hypothetical protein
MHAGLVLCVVLCQGRVPVKTACCWLSACILWIAYVNLALQMCRSSLSYLGRRLNSICVLC